MNHYIPTKIVPSKTLLNHFFVFPMVGYVSSLEVPTLLPIPVDTWTNTKVTERIQSEALGPVVQVSKVTIAPRLPGELSWKPAASVFCCDNDVAWIWGEGNGGNMVYLNAVFWSFLVKIPFWHLLIHTYGMTYVFFLNWPGNEKCHHFEVRHM